MAIFAQRIFFVGAKRTPFGAYLGSLSALSATDLGVHAAEAAIAAAGISSERIDHVIFGNVLQTSRDAIYIARHIGLRAGIPEKVPALTVNRLCGSGFEAIIQGARLLNSQEADCVLVGGSESMTQAPHIIRGARHGLPLGQGKLEDSLWECLTDTYVDMPMGITAENLAEHYRISQDEVDRYSLLSQQRYQEGLQKGAFVEEIAAIETGLKKGPSMLTEDEHPRRSVVLSDLKRLPKVFKRDGVIHAGAASGIGDGAGALVMCHESFVRKNRLKPIGELISFGISGCDPKIMGIGPVPAIRDALRKINTTLMDMGMIEINEAFAPQILAVKKELELDPGRLNIHGGAIALGHPLAASGARLTAHLLHNLSDEQLGLASACIGGGQGIAVVVKKSSL